MARPIPPLDLMWLIMETQASPTHVGALLLFEKPKGRPRVGLGGLVELALLGGGL